MAQFIAGAYLDDRISVVKTKELSFDWRLDSEHYRPDYIKQEKALLQHATKEWKDLEGDFIVGPFGSAFKVDNYVNQSEYRYIRGKDVKPFFLRDNDNAYMPEEDYLRLERYALFHNDILVSVVGTLGNVALVNEDVGKAIFSCKSIAYRSREVDPYYIMAYLNSSIGQSFFQRRARGAIQMGLNLPDLQTLPIFIPDKAIEQTIGNIIRQAWAKSKESKRLYEEAEDLLLEALGLDTLDLSPQLSFTATWGDVETAARLDAEYFQPEKQVVLQALYKMSGHSVSYHFDSIYDLVNANKEKVPRKVYNYDLTDALRYFLDEETETTLTTELGSTKKQFQTNDVVVSRLRSYLKEIAIVATSPKSLCVGSSEFLIFRQKSKLVNPELLLMYLRSEPVQKILKWCQTGSNHPRFDEKEILTLKIPQCIIAIQNEITVLVQQGIQFHREAKQLLEEAKQRVETMILAGSEDT